MNKKTILYTGATGGLGAIVCRELAMMDYNMALHTHHNEDKAEDLAEDILANGGIAKVFQADLTQTHEVLHLIETVRESFGEIDVLINNAAVSESAISWKLDDESWGKSIELNLTAPFQLIKQTIPRMRQLGWGRIINITSIVGQTGFAGTASYTASKAGLAGLTKTIAKEVAQHGVTVNNIELGYFSEGMIHTIPAELQDQIKSQIPAGKFGDPREIAGCIAYLCQDTSSYLTGQTLRLNGGMN